MKDGTWHVKGKELVFCSESLRFKISQSNCMWEIWGSYQVSKLTL